MDQQIEWTELTEWEFVKLDTVEVDAAEWARLAVEPVEPVEPVDAKREPVMCRCCGRRVTNSDREPIHTFPCMTRHARHQRGKAASRCHEYRSKSADKGAA